MMTKQRAAENVRAYWHCALRHPDPAWKTHYVRCVAYWMWIWRVAE